MSNTYDAVPAFIT